MVLSLGMILGSVDLLKYSGMGRGSQGSVDRRGVYGKHSWMFGGLWEGKLG